MNTEELNDVQATRGPDRSDEARLRAELDRLTAERDKLQQFKDWVHAYLDAHGVPHHPPGPHGAEGCRIGDRMDWLMARVAEHPADDAAPDLLGACRGLLLALGRYGRQIDDLFGHDEMFSQAQDDARAAIAKAETTDR